MNDNTLESDQDIASSFLNNIQEGRQEVNIYLVNGIRLKGFIHKYDKDSVLLRNGGIQLVRVNAISTIMPDQPVASSHNDSWGAKRG